MTKLNGIDKALVYSRERKTEELAKMDVVKIEDPHIIFKLALLGFEYCEIRGECYYLATEEFDKALEVLVKRACCE